MVIATLVVLALLQALLLSLTGSGNSRTVSVVLALAASSAAVAGIVARYRMLILGLLSVLIVANLLQHVTLLAPPIPYRVAHVAILAGYLAVAFALAGAVLAGTTVNRAFMATALMAVIAVAAESALERFERQPSLGVATWTGANEPHPDLGYVNPPNTVRRTLYPNNPRGYFAENAPSPWKLEIHHSGSAGRLQLPPDRPTLLRVTIERADDPTAYNIQLNQPGISVVAGERYALSFDARADGERTMSYGISMAHAPFDSLGYYREAKLGRQWQAVSEQFVLPSGDVNARLHFDLGAGPASVEIDHVRLRHLPSGELVRHASAATEFFVSYRFNELDCRGANLPRSRPTGRRRILILGDSYALGEGVHEADTFAARLATSLNTPTVSSTASGFDVINCSTRGYTLQQMRQQYEMIGSRYEPDIVLLSMTPHDERSWRAETDMGSSPDAGAVSKLFVVARFFQSPAAQRLGPTAVAPSDLVGFAEAARARSARLVMTVFPQKLDGGHTGNLPTVLSTAAEKAKIPFLDLGPILLKDRNPADLQVHPLDKHANEIAHRIAAVEIEQLLRSNGLIAN